MDKTKRLYDVYAKAEVRAAEGGKSYIEGMIPYNSRSEEMWGFVEVLAPSAFNKTLGDGANVFAFWAHDERDVLLGGASPSAGAGDRTDLHLPILATHVNFRRSPHQ